MAKRSIRFTSPANPFHDISFQNCSILDRNLPGVDGSLELFKASNLTPDVCLPENPGEETRMKDTLLWFVWIPAAAILLVLLINTFVIP